MSPRSPLPTCWRRDWLTSFRPFIAPTSATLAASTASAVALFLCWLRSDSIRTLSPVGRWMAITADSVLFRCCPPGPSPFVVVISTSLRFSPSGVSGMLSTATVTVEVWTRPRFSVGGMRCHRWPPPSLRKSPTFAPMSSSARKPGRRSKTSRSKSPPGGAGRVHRQHVLNEELCIFAALSRADL